jgi:hypothetical protein
MGEAKLLLLAHAKSFDSYTSEDIALAVAVKEAVTRPSKRQRTPSTNHDGVAPTDASRTWAIEILSPNANSLLAYRHTSMPNCFQSSSNAYSRKLMITSLRPGKIKISAAAPTMAHPAYRMPRT